MSGELIGSSASTTELRRLIQSIAGTDGTVLITGDHGVGKETAAHMIHRLSGRSRQPMVMTNCADLPEAVLESELFGHVTGSFAGAFRDKQGSLERADGGTLFLDEIGQASLRIQGLLLRFIETREVHRVGSDQAGKHVNVRIIAATSRNLVDLIAAGTFREDLYYRLNVIPIRIPPLRERREDIQRLVQHFVDHFAGEGRHVALSQDATAVMTNYRWPGNVRELQNVVERLVAARRRSGRVIEEADLPFEVRTNLDPNERRADFEVMFPEDCSPSDVKEILTALANYYRACGGIGFEVTFESEDVPSVEHVGA